MATFQGKVLLALCFLLALAAPTRAQTGCCSSSDGKTCMTGSNLPTTYQACFDKKGYHTWLPFGSPGAASTCIVRNANTACTSNAQCCGSNVCDGRGDDFRNKKCYSPIDVCGSFNRDLNAKRFCETRASCKWDALNATSGVCVPNFNFTWADPATKPKDIPDDPGCCSSSLTSCDRREHKFYDSCVAFNGGWNRDYKWVWYPNGTSTLQPGCLALNSACTSNAQCCGSNVCDGRGDDFRNKKCYTPVDLCRSFNNDRRFCDTRATCRWNQVNATFGSCVPNFNYTYVEAATKPKDIPDDPGCCSQDTFACAKSPKVFANCVDANGGWNRDFKWIWYPQGIPSNQSSCLRLNTACTSNDQCCGSTVCDGRGDDFRNKKCYHPVDLCWSFNNNRRFCDTRATCRWNQVNATFGTCVPNFNYTFVEAATKPKSIPEDPGCCSTNTVTCDRRDLRFFDVCTNITSSNNMNKWVWYPNGTAVNPPGCLGLNVACTSNTQCCGSNVCDGMGDDFRNKKCYTPVDLCRSFNRDINAKRFCDTRAACKWNQLNATAGVCIPNFNYTFVEVATKPKDIPDDPGCCSSSLTSCDRREHKFYDSCVAFNGGWNRDYKWVWYPNGTATLQPGCLALNANCTSNAQCCGSTVCDGRGDDFRVKRCNHPVDLCWSFNNNRRFCDTRATCRWNQVNATFGSCVPNFNYTFVEAATKPKDIPDDPGCCSTNQLNCDKRNPRFYDECVSRHENNIWFPQGVPADVCKVKESNCTKNSECCGTLICEEGTSTPIVSRCRDPIPTCRTFNTEPWCNSRSACKWDASTGTGICRPSFNATIYNPETKPATVDRGPGCCSENHETCSTSRRNLVTREMCVAANSRFVWLKDGPITTPCFSSTSTVHCTKNDQCCGTLVCAPLSNNAFDVKCRSPSWICPTYTASGMIKCNAVPGCKWDAAACKVSFDGTMFDAGFAQVRSTLKEPVLVKSQLEGNPDRLGLCTGFVAHMHGDPHINTFDRNYYNCMGTGAFVLAKAPGMLEIQGLFYQAGGGAASVTRGIAIDYPALPDVPRIQISMNETGDRADPTTYMINNDCAAHVFLDGELKPAKRENHYSDEGSYAMVFNKDGSVDIQFFNEAEAPITAVQITVWGAPKGTFGCVMNVRTCLPLSEPELRNKTVGLLGTPNGNILDEWKTENGTVIPVAPSGKDQYKYCTSNHCVGRKADSLFIYEGKSFKDLWSCNAEFPGEPDVSQVPPAIQDLCNGDLECLLEGLGGLDNAVRNLEEEELIKDIVVENKVVEEVKFNITPPVIEDDCKWPRTGSNACPGDVSLLNYPATPLPLFVQSPVNIVSQTGDKVTFNISNPFQDKMQAMYYQYFEGDDVKCLAKANLAECIKPVTVTATCRAGRDAKHKATLKFTTVEFWFVDPTVIRPADNYTIPQCCQPDTKVAKVPTALYTYKVYCETSCPVTADARRLRHQ